MATPAPHEGSPRTALVKALSAIARQRPYQLYAILWLLAALYLATTPARTYLIPGLGLALLYTLYGLISLRFVPIPLQEPKPTPPLPARRLWLQSTLLLVVILITGMEGLTHHGILPQLEFPLWSPFFAHLTRSLGSHLPSPTFVRNPVAYVAIPATLLLLSGARWQDLGSGRAHAPWRLILIWSSHALIAIALGLLLGWTGPLGMLQRFGSNFLNNGFMEEFLWRGALQTRLQHLVGVEWATMLSSLGFGLWHIGLTISMAGGEVLSGVAIAILIQGAAGLQFSLLFRWSRNLLAPSIVHILSNAMPF